jgi:vacuolar-type H+-ATPase subunit H
METELSPLDQIRMAEANAARKLALSRELAEIKITQARYQARVLVDEARESGKHEGQVQYAEIVSRAEEEAEGLVAEAQARVEALRREGELRMQAAVDQVIQTLLGN